MRYAGRVSVTVPNARPASGPVNHLASASADIGAGPPSGGGPAPSTAPRTRAPQPEEEPSLDVREHAAPPDRRTGAPPADRRTRHVLRVPRGAALRRDVRLRFRFRRVPLRPAGHRVPRLAGHGGVRPAAARRLPAA